ncbi:MAG: M20/M25/M40 family metallo-hydrolase, partial [Pyramidobacter sp.]|nr:M20/M25/M40 family metallo-hydrolase [Pyramidobacter sp.]
MENRLNHERLVGTLKAMGRVGVGADGKRSRLALSDGDKQARDLLCSWIREAGLELKVDAIGNIFGVLPGTEDGDPVFAGSHIDTVPDAGMFDGCVGVLSGLEALRTIAEKGLPHRRSLAVAALTNEEGSRFLPGTMGSMVMEGLLSLEDARRSRDKDGFTVGAELDRIGYAGNDALHPRAFMELHVEQGPYLDAE